MVEVGGKPQIVRQIETLQMLGCSGITCMVRDDYPEAQDAVLDRKWKVPVNVCLCHTPSSLHTLAEGLAEIPEGAVFATMVDTVMRADDWKAAFAGSKAALEQGADVALVVTPFVDDEAALWVRKDATGRVTSLGKEPVSPPCVTGGVYALRPGIGALASAAVRSGMHRMRAFLGDLVQQGLVVQSVEVPRVIDLDRKEDLAAANAWLVAEAQA
jgi:NDP-sugar pyrophosphorylase family protein